MRLLVYQMDPIHWPHWVNLTSGRGILLNTRLTLWNALYSFSSRKTCILLRVTNPNKFFALKNYMGDHEYKLELPHVKMS